MKQISEECLIQLKGGFAMENCSFLEEIAADHEVYENPEAEEAWWAAWYEVYKKCHGITD